MKNKQVLGQNMYNTIYIKIKTSCMKYISVSKLV